MNNNIDYVVAKLISRLDKATDTIERLRPVYNINEADFELVPAKIIRGLLNPNDKLLPKGMTRLEARGAGVKYLTFIERYASLLRKVDRYGYQAVEQGEPVAVRA